MSRRESTHEASRPSTRHATARSTGTLEGATPLASAASPQMLTAVSPQHAWCNQLKSIGVAEVGALRSSDGKWGTAAKDVASTSQEAATSSRPTGRESSVDRILMSSVKQHTYTYAPSRLPFTLEKARSPYVPVAGGVDERVQVEPPKLKNKIEHQSP